LSRSERQGGDFDFRSRSRRNTPTVGVTVQSCPRANQATAWTIKALRSQRSMTWRMPWRWMPHSISPLQGRPSAASWTGLWYRHAVLCAGPTCSPGNRFRFRCGDARIGQKQTSLLIRRVDRVSALLMIIFVSASTRHWAVHAPIQRSQHSWV
jgi:hypothetical protein